MTMPCGADLKAFHALNQHVTGRTHKQKLQAALNDQFGTDDKGADKDDRNRGNFSPASYRRTVSFDCPRAMCRNRISGKEGATARCDKCKGEFVVPKATSEGSSGKHRH